MDEEFSCFIIIGGVDRSGTTLLASLLANIEGSVVIPEMPFKFDFVDRKVATKVRERYFEKYYLAHGFQRVPKKNELFSYLSDTSATYIIDHTPKNRLFFRKFLDAGNICIHIHRQFGTLCLSHQNVSWGTHLVWVLYLRWLKDRFHCLFCKVALRSKQKYFSVSYEDLLNGKHGSLLKFLRHKGLNVKVGKNGHINPKEIPLPDFTREQHRMVGGEIYRNNINALNAYPWTRLKIKIKLLEWFGLIVFPIIFLVEISLTLEKLKTLK